MCESKYARSRIHHHRSLYDKMFMRIRLDSRNFVDRIAAELNSEPGDLVKIHTMKL